MKTILVPVDFSEACDNALDYAVEFAKASQAQLRLLNAYTLPVMSTEPFVWVPSTPEIMDENIKRLENVRDRIWERHGKQLDIECYCEVGTVIEVINGFATRNHTDLIIMGMQGGGFVSEKIIGSTTTSLMRHSVCPVMGIGKQVKFSPIRQIVLATDHEEADYMEALQPLKNMVLQFDAHLFILYVIEPGIKARRGVPTGIQVARALDGIPYTAHTVIGDDVTTEIAQFVEDKAIDITAIVPRKRSFFDLLFRESHTNKLAFHTHVPVLALHE